MKVVTQYPDNIFAWVDLTSTNIEAAKPFYKGLFGWDSIDMPTDMGSNYTMFQIDGKNVAGGGVMPPDMQAQGIPSYWTSYIKHDNVDEVAAKVADAGGTLLFPPMDVMTSGRMTMLQDPSGATVGVWQPRDHIGAQLVNMPNTLVWNELQTRDGETAKTFYGQVFGWANHTDENGYTVYSADGRMQAGMILIDESWGPMPPNWAVYFMVEDVAATVAKAQALGGNILVPLMPAGDMGQFAVIQDPAGAAFTTMQFNGPVDPPPGHSHD